MKPFCFLMIIIQQKSAISHTSSRPVASFLKVSRFGGLPLLFLTFITLCCGASVDFPSFFPPGFIIVAKLPLVWSEKLAFDEAKLTNKG